MSYLLSAVIGYLFGSIPTAYLLIKKAKGIDIRNEGSGNVGAYNSFDVSKSKLVGISVLLIDLLKGIASVLIIKFIFPGSFTLPALSLFFAVFSHCYNPWIGFDGGRGLATAAGGALFIIPLLPIVWLILFFVFYALKKDILFANIIAIIMTILVVFSLIKIETKYSFPNPEDESSLVLFSTSILVLIFIKHVEPLKELLQKYLKKKND
jgi:acyl phosphate:glycerol-3-phosphate acyltransferase